MSDERVNRLNTGLVACRGDLHQDVPGGRVPLQTPIRRAGA